MELYAYRHCSLCSESISEVIFVEIMENVCDQSDHDVSCRIVMYCCL